MTEPERYELSEGPAYLFALGRRAFVKLMGGGLAVFALPIQESGERRNRFGEDMPAALSSWIHIDEDGSVHVYTGKVEVGQNVRTSLTQAVSEELRVPMRAVRLTMGDTALTPYDMGTFGSRTTPIMAAQLRKVAATARELLLDLAAKEGNVDRQSLEIREGIIHHRETGWKASYGDLTRGKKLAHDVRADAPIAPPAGTSPRKVESASFVTGSHRYSTDLKRDGMLHGKLLRPPSVGAALSSADTREAEAMTGVIVVRDGDFVGVAAPGEEEATRALESIRAQWTSAPQPSGKEIFEFLKSHPAEARGFGGRSFHEAGAIEEGLARADLKLEQRYTVAYIAHAPLEPRAAVAEWNGDELTVWTGTQRPFGVQGELAEAFHVPEANVRVLVPDTGSAYGGKHTGETAVEAARLARACNRPVRVVWTREEEFTWAYFRPAGLIEVASGMSKDGSLVAWKFDNYNSGSSAIRTLYEIPHQRIEFHPAASPLRQGSYRGLAATANHFARETHMDELAHAARMDPLELRLKNLKDPRLRAVLEAAATKIGWASRRPESNAGFGIAGGFEKGSYVANAVEVAVGTNERLQIRRVVTAFECGAIVHPDGLRNQVEGSVIMGLGGALFEAIDFDNGKILNPSFSQYRVPRFKDVPALETVLLDREDLPSAGAGETPIVTIAPALGNAIFAATGKRHRSLPFA